MYNELNKFFKKEAFPALISWIALSLILYLARFGISTKWETIVESIIGSLALTVLWLVIRFSAAQQIRDFVDRQPKTKIIIEEQSHVDNLKECRPLWMHYTNYLTELFNDIKSLTAGSDVDINPYVAYSLILSCAEHCVKSIYSVDCDLDAWFNLCEADDFDVVYKKYPDKCNELKIKFLEERRRRSRTDFTYKLSTIFMQRLLGEGTLDGKNPLKRVFIIRNKEENLTATQRMIIGRICRLQDNVKARMLNKVLFVPDLDALSNSLSDLLRELQDIVIFDESVAFKEFLLDPNDERAQSGVMFIKEEKIRNYVNLFNELFDTYAIKIHEINKHLEA